MAPQRATRSLRSTGPAPEEAGLAEKSLKQLRTPKETGTQAQPKPRRSNITSPRAARSKNANKAVAPAAEAESEADESGDEEEEESEQTDVLAPSNGTQDLPNDSVKAPEALQVKTRSGVRWAGRLNQTVESENHEETDSTVASPIEKNVEADGSAASEDESNVSSDSDVDIRDDDDGYDALEKMSNSSEGSETSAAFEAAVEREVIAEDAAGMIDWDRESIFDYDDSAEAPYMDASELVLFPTFRDDYLRDINGHGDDTAAHDGGANGEVEVIALERWPTSESSSSDESDSQKQAVQTQRSSISIDDGETTDEDEEMLQSATTTPVNLSRRSTISSPTKTSANRTSRYRRLTNTDSSTPVMRKFKVNPHRAVAYSEHTPHGRIVHFKLPKNGSVLVVDLRRGDSNSSSGASSPTMINLDEALVSGNTNSGAHITDVINAHLFRSFHCTQRASDSFDSLVPAEFDFAQGGAGAWRPLTRTESNDDFFMQLDDVLDDPDAQVFIDFAAFESDSERENDAEFAAVLEKPTASRKRRASERSEAGAARMKRRSIALS